MASLNTLKTTASLNSILSESQNPFRSQPPPLPSHLQISQISTSTELSQFRRINSLLLPIRYPDTFYNDILLSPLINTLTLIATYTDPKSPASHTVVGGIRCRLEPVPPDGSDSQELPQQRQRLYILTLAVLSPYRHLGLATHLLNNLISNALSNPLANDLPVIEVYAHVWETNEDARVWYGKRGFREDGGVIEGYYRRLKPGGAVVTRRGVGVREWLNAKGKENEEPDGQEPDEKEEFKDNTDIKG